MLLPTNSSSPVFQQDLYHSVTEKTKLFASKCMNRSLSPIKDKSYDALRGRFRFCVCTGPRKNKRTAKWYVKVRQENGAHRQPSTLRSVKEALNIFLFKTRVKSLVLFMCDLFWFRSFLRLILELNFLFEETWLRRRSNCFISLFPFKFRIDFRA